LLGNSLGSPTLSLENKEWNTEIPAGEIHRIALKNNINRVSGCSWISKDPGEEVSFDFQGVEGREIC